jgi:hypothetical protein
MDSKYLIFGGLALGGVVLFMVMRGGTTPANTTTTSIPSQTTGSNVGGGTVADVPDLGGVDWIAPANTPLTVINELIASGFTAANNTAPLGLLPSDPSAQPLF